MPLLPKLGSRLPPEGKQRSSRASRRGRKEDGHRGLRVLREKIRHMMESPFEEAVHVRRNSSSIQNLARAAGQEGCNQLFGGALACCYEIAPALLRASNRSLACRRRVVS